MEESINRRMFEETKNGIFPRTKKKKKKNKKKRTKRRRKKVSVEEIVLQFPKKKDGILP